MLHEIFLQSFYIAEFRSGYSKKLIIIFRYNSVDKKRACAIEHRPIFFYFKSAPVLPVAIKRTMRASFAFTMPLLSRSPALNWLALKLTMPTE